MNALTVLLAVVASCNAGSLYGYPGLYGGYPGFYGQYPYGVGHAALPYGVGHAALPYGVGHAALPYGVGHAGYPLTYGAAPYAPVQSQYHAQDELGQYSYGYAGGPSARSETRDAFGVVRGSYNYIDSEGKVQTQHYVADALGFRVSGTNLPVAPDAPAAALPGPVPEPVQDTAEVAAAKAAFQAAYDEAAAAAAAAPDSSHDAAVPAAIRDALLLRIVHKPRSRCLLLRSCSSDVKLPMVPLSPTTQATPQNLPAERILHIPSSSTLGMLREFSTLTFMTLMSLASSSIDPWQSEAWPTNSRKKAGHLRSSSGGKGPNRSCGSQYKYGSSSHPSQTAPSRWVNMNALTVLLAVVASCNAGSLYGYPGLYGGYPGFYGQYPYGVGHAALPYGVGHAALPYGVGHAGYPLTYGAAPYAPVQSQYHAQDELGQYSYGYAGGPSARSETRDAFGVVRGSYNYIDSEGKVQTQHYVADALGFRVSGTNLPVAPDAPAAALPGPVPEPVQDTAEVAAAKAAFQAAYDEAAAAAAAAPDTRKKRSVVTAPFLGAYSAPLSFGYSTGIPYAGAFPYFAGGVGVTPYTGLHSYGYAAAAPAAALRDAELLRIVHNPGHAVSYRVD
ncbi:uncharacterized protein [Panulirus ornatus]|uniref:uncharacterized protein n=1 Tax=Panulirus ornatus TaxID=150431 RepID=UPI003A84CF26